MRGANVSRYPLMAKKDPCPHNSFLVVRGSTYGKERPIPHNSFLVVTGSTYGKERPMPPQPSSKLETPLPLTLIPLSLAPPPIYAVSRSIYSTLYISHKLTTLELVLMFHYLYVLFPLLFPPSPLRATQQRCIDASTPAPFPISLIPLR